MLEGSLRGSQNNHSKVRADKVLFPRKRLIQCQECLKPASHKPYELSVLLPLPPFALYRGYLMFRKVSTESRIDIFVEQYSHLGGGKILEKSSLREFEDSVDSLARY